MLKELLKNMVAQEGSDLYLTTLAPPSIKVNGRLCTLSYPAFESGEVKKIAYELMDCEQKATFEKALEMNFAIHEPDLGRFRVNVFIQRTEVGLVIRRIHTIIPTIDSLQLPSILKEITLERRGLVLYVGASGCGKSTSLAAMINHRNVLCHDHIVTVEDPIEFVHEHINCIINQREVGMDTKSYAEALKHTLRQAPDLILIGEIRCRETMESAMSFAETGHLCLSTLHANNTYQALDRIINFFPEEKRSQLLLDLSFNLKAIISQRLVPTLDKKRIPAVEILLATPLICALIRKGDIESVKNLMENSTNLGMQTFDQALEKLYFNKKISLDEALRHADSANNLRIKIKLREEGQQAIRELPESLFKRIDTGPNRKPKNGKDTGLSLTDE